MDHDRRDRADVAGDPGAAGTRRRVAPVRRLRGRIRSPRDRVDRRDRADRDGAARTVRAQDVRLDASLLRPADQPRREGACRGDRVGVGRGTDLAVRLVSGAAAVQSVEKQQERPMTRRRAGGALLVFFGLSACSRTPARGRYASPSPAAQGQARRSQI